MYFFFFHSFHFLFFVFFFFILLLSTFLLMLLLFFFILFSSSFFYFLLLFLLILLFIKLCADVSDMEITNNSMCTSFSTIPMNTVTDVLRHRTTQTPTDNIYYMYMNIWKCFSCWLVHIKMGNYKIVLKRTEYWCIQLQVHP